MAVIVLATNWWAFVIRGFLAILFGLLAFLMPGIALWGLVLLFGIYSVTDGIFNIAAAFNARRGQNRWWLLLLEGVISIAAGVIAFVYPGITALALLIVIASWAIVTGVLEIAAAIRLRREISGEWMLALDGLFSILFGAILLWRPGAGALALIWWIAAYAIVFGALLIALGLRLRSWVRGLEGGTAIGTPVPSH